METYEVVKKILSDYGLWGLLILFVVYALFNPEKLQIIASWLWFPFGYIFKYARRKKIQYSIEGHCTKALKEITKELPDIEIPNLKINWVKDNDLQSILNNGKAIVKLKFSTDETKNIIKATTVYVRDAFLKHTKPYISNQLKESINFSVTKKILLNTTKNTRNIISQFIEDTSFTEEIRNKCSQIQEIDDNGLFTSILLRELDFYGTQLIGQLPNNEHIIEADRLLEFIFDIADRDPDELTPLQFLQNTLKISVLLVAKIENFMNYGLMPYLRRIKLGLASGINTFYLLARDDKVDILKEVAKQLLETGNFILINKPKEFKDSKRRDVIYYCLRVNKDSYMAKAMKEISDAIKSRTTVSGVIIKVKNDSLKVEVDGVEGIVKNNNLSTISISEPYKYFRENTTIELLPLDIESNGIVEFSVKNTKSDPHNFINANYEIGKSIIATVNYCDDEFIKLTLYDNKIIEGIAYRRDLTYSRFIFLHKKFLLENDYEFVIKGTDFERNQVILVLKDLPDPWRSIRFTKNQTVSFMPYKKTDKSIVGELLEGLEAILPYSELSWIKSEIETEKNKIKIDKQINCIIKEIDRKEKRIILTFKSNSDNPYVNFYNTNKYDANKNNQLKFVVISMNAYGIVGLIDNKFDIFIPKYEQSWNGKENFNYQIGKKYNVCLKEIDKSGNGLIGTFKPIIKHPLKSFAEKFQEGQKLKFLRIKEKYHWGAVFNIVDGKKNYDCLLFNSDISNNCFITSIQDVLKNVQDLPLAIKSIDFDKNRILMSLKDLTNSNLCRLQNVKYNTSYDGIILSKKGFDYCILLKGIWVEAILETSKKYNIGDVVQVRPSKIEEKKLILTDE